MEFTQIGETRIKNLTPHAITIIGMDGVSRVFPPSGVNVRIDTLRGLPSATVGDVEIPLFGSDTFGDVVLIDNTTKRVVSKMSDIPESVGQLFIVSGMAGAVLRDRSDVFVPMTAPSDKPIRNEKGHIVAVRGLKRP